MLEKIAIAFCTYKRTQACIRLIDVLFDKIIDLKLPVSVIVVDNDGTDPAIINYIAEKRISHGADITYVVELKPGISAARNTAFACAEELKVRFLAMLDDDEWPSEGWLTELLDCQHRTGSAVIGGPVKPVFPSQMGDLERYSRFWSVNKLTIRGRVMVFCTCNFLVDLDQIADLPRPLFDEEFGLSGGGDVVFFRRLFFKGLSMEWAEEALVYEDVPLKRASIRWMMQRRFRSGNHAVRWESLNERNGKVLLKTLALVARLPIYPFLNREPEAKLVGWLFEMQKIRGRIAAHCGHHFVEYSRGPSVPNLRSCC